MHEKFIINIVFKICVEEFASRYSLDRHKESVHVADDDECETTTKNNETEQEQDLEDEESM